MAAGVLNHSRQQEQQEAHGKFYGNSKDTLTARKFIERIEQATTIGVWNNTRKCAEFCQLWAHS